MFPSPTKKHSADTKYVFRRQSVITYTPHTGQKGEQRKKSEVGIKKTYRILSIKTPSAEVLYTVQKSINPSSVWITNLIWNIFLQADTSGIYVEKPDWNRILKWLFFTFNEKGKFVPSFAK